MIKITVTDSVNDKILNLEVESDELVENLKALIEVELNVPLAQQSIVFNNKVLLDNVKLSSVGIGNGSVLLLTRASVSSLLGNFDFSAVQVPQRRTSNPSLEQMAANETQKLIKLTSNKELLQNVKNSNSELYEAITSGNAKRVQDIVLKNLEEKKKKYDETQRMIRLVEREPMNPEAQRWMIEQQNQQNIDENLSLAQEHFPEAFAQVVMLYIPCEVNQKKMNAFVDSGAQTTIMSLKCAENCGLMRLIDKRFHGTALGVGSAKIVGRIHMVQMKIGSIFLPISLTVLDDNKMSLLFGLDLLRRHQCIIDLENNCLRVAGQNVSFLPESEIGSDDMSQQQNKPASPVHRSSEELVKNLVALGFSAEESLMALKTCNFDTNLAVELLLQHRGHSN
eukprot:GHVL01003535.1.p1 GENE.GHVL01003535.1~~GHVL01003535.1.p1  ORF type:complete len:395 (+),score=83.26 GHVL01003535.1:20-1204(+)